MGNGDDASLHGLMLQLLKRQDALEDAIREQREMLKTISMSQGQHLLATSLMMAFDNNSATITSNQVRFLVSDVTSSSHVEVSRLLTSTLMAVCRA